MESGDRRSQLHLESRQDIVNNIGEIGLVETEMGDANGEDWQEQIYQKIKSMNEMYFPELNEMYQRMAAKLQKNDVLPQQARNEQLEKLRFFKFMLERLIMFLRTNKNEILPNHREKIVLVEKQIVNILSSNRPRKPISSSQQG